jgi:dipeptidyl aminopeptidase/acylaminoacyl peptidase
VPQTTSSREKLRGVSATLAALLLLGLLVLPADVTAVVPGPTGPLAFMRKFFRNWDVYVLNTDGTETRLTSQPGADTLPVWSPDGSRLSFSSSKQDKEALDIWVMNADGSGPVQLTVDPADDRRAVWSPDGTRLAFTSERDGNKEVYLMGADGTDVLNLTRHPAQDSQPAWSPDGTRIAFTSTRQGGATDLWVMNADGSNQRMVAHLPGHQRHAAWSPNSRRIAFDGRQAGNYDVYVIDAEGQGPPLQLTNAPENEDDPAWAPSGSRILYASEVDGENDIRSVKLDGSSDSPVVATNSLEERPDVALGSELVVTASDTGFAGETSLVRQGTPVRWSFQGTEEHTATETTLGLFDSGPRSAGESFTYTFASAGSYRYRCTLHTGHNANLAVPVVVIPQTGGSGTSLQVTWSAAPPPEDWAFDVIVKPPGSSKFVAWRTDETATQAMFEADAGAGTYEFRARLRPVGATAKSGYSPVTAITIV